MRLPSLTGMSDLEKETSHLVRGLQMAMTRQSEKSYRGTSPDKMAAAKISGRHELVELRLEAADLGITDEQAEKITSSVKEAINRALVNAQSAARRALEEGLDGKG